jgi:hypothetical protein
VSLFSAWGLLPSIKISISPFVGAQVFARFHGKPSSLKFCEIGTPGSRALQAPSGNRHPFTRLESCRSLRDRPSVHEATEGWSPHMQQGENPSLATLFPLHTHPHHDHNPSARQLAGRRSRD